MIRIITKEELKDLSYTYPKKFLPFVLSFAWRILGFNEKFHILLKIPYYIRLNEKIEAIRYLPSINSYKIIFKKDLVLKENKNE